MANQPSPLGAGTHPESTDSLHNPGRAAAPADALPFGPCLPLPTSPSSYQPPTLSRNVSELGNSGIVEPRAGFGPAGRVGRASGGGVKAVAWLESLWFNLLCGFYPSLSYGLVCKSSLAARQPLSHSLHSLLHTYPPCSLFSRPLIRSTPPRLLKGKTSGGKVGCVARVAAVDWPGVDVCQAGRM